MKKLFKKYQNSFILALVIIILIIAAVFLLRSDKSEGQITLSLTSDRVGVGEETFLIIKVENTGSRLLEGFFNLTADDPERINVSVDSDRVTYNLLPGESLERRIPITGTSSSIRTDYEITGFMISNDTIISSDSVILSVRR